MSSKSQLKRCTKCGDAKPLIAFSPAVEGRRKSQCNACRALAQAQYRLRHPQPAYEKTRRRKRDRTQWAAQARAAYARNRERELLRAERYRKLHPEVGQRGRLTRRAREVGAFREAVDPAVLFKRDKGRCGICFKPVKKSDASVDHIVALAKGGEHSYANTQLAHRRCNSSKSTKTIGQLRIDLSPKAAPVVRASDVDAIFAAMLLIFNNSFGTGHAAGTDKVTGQEPLPFATTPMLFGRPILMN